MYYTLRKDNSRVDALNKKSNYIKIREIFTYSILKENINGLLLINKYKLGIIICIIKNKQKWFLIDKKISIYIQKSN